MKNCMTKRMRDSVNESYYIISAFATIFTVIGFSLKDMFPLSCVQSGFIAVILRGVILTLAYGLGVYIVWIIKGYKYKESINLKVGSNEITVKNGNIFKQDAWRVIAVDTHFSTTVDDLVISKTSLHGQLVLEHGDVNGIKAAVKIEAERRDIKPDKNNQYTFPLGTAITYEGNDGNYIMVALTDLDDDNEAHTTMLEYESTLMNIWKEISRIYAKKNLALPILGSGITRFDDGRDNPANLLRCMLCTLNTSNVHFKSNVCIVVYDSCANKNSIPLYEYKDLFRILR